MPPARSLSPTGERPLPPARDGWFDLIFAVTIDQDFVRVTAEVDVWANWRERRPLVPPETRARIERFAWAEAAPVETVDFGLEDAFAKVDRLADGRWVLAHPRCRVGVANACILDPDGTVAGRMCLGDGIAHLQCDAEGRIWVGYFDEGVYGNNGWGDQGAPDPIGAGGLIAFTPGGTALWRWFDQPGPSIDDCYALNVGRDGIWSCFYSAFPLLRVSPGLDSRLWANGVRGASLVAADGDHAILLGGYPPDRERLALLRLGAEAAEVVATFAMPGWADSFVAARGGDLHFVAPGSWRRLSVAEVLAASR